MQPTNPSDLSPQDLMKVADFLDSHPAGVLATVDHDGNPNASTIYFGVGKDLEVTFTTKEGTRKYQNIERHNTVMLVVFDPESQSAVQVSGKARLETDPEVTQKIYHSTLRAAKQTSEDNVPPVAKIAAGPYVAYTITPDKVSMSEYGWGDSLTNALEQAVAPEETSVEDPA